ncbi:uncharacterized protein RHO25_011706 [Cercospora beticola]|uniref:Heterokaryon incompatibility domain-containing protein n=1 Tax=Cercospora beticola TaxID=122368 RepID=A0ABZ0P5F7_CERBT|nr:hypothetical protein RHO25_011706 [Cercospora beticola]
MFWIDKVRINQQDKKKKKQMAVNAMDLLYKNASKAIAMLSSPIKSQTELKMLIYLLVHDLEDDSNLATDYQGSVVD